MLIRLRLYEIDVWFTHFDQYFIATMDVRGYSHQLRWFQSRNQASCLFPIRTIRPSRKESRKLFPLEFYTEPVPPSEIALDSSMEDIPSLVEFEEAASSESVFSDLSHSDWDSHISDEENDISLSA